jgi:sugar phosphate isomerase/epimerase
MVLAYPVATPEIKEEYMGLHGNFEENIRQLKQAGFDAVELFTCNPDLIDAAGIESVLARYSMDVAAVGTSHLINRDGLSLMGLDREKCAAALSRLQSVILLASTFEAPVSIGKFRGNMSAPQSPNEYRQFVESLRKIGHFARDHGVCILIEPQNSKNINNINSVAEACRLLDEVSLPNLLLHLDTYHLDLTEDNPAASILSARRKIRFIHLADSERKIPGEGHIDLAAIFKALSSIDYKGHLSFEIKQGENPFATARKAFSETSRILRSIQ